MDASVIAARLAPLFGRPEVELVVLFGSHVAGSARPASDVDLGVRLVPGGDLEAARLEAARLLGTDRLDLVDLRRAPPLLMMSVARHGRPLYQRTGVEFAEFASLALRRYNDTAKLRRLREEGLRAFLRERGLA